MLKTVIHCHTNFSFDSDRSPEALIETALRQGVGCVALTDHDAIDGALRAREDGRVRIIVGEEVSTRDGHLIGLFIERLIPPGLSALETAERIKEQGGLVLAPHPFSSLCDDSLGDTMDELLPLLDAVEICNAQNPLPWQDRRAARFAEAHGLPAYVGSDAHFEGYLDTCHQWMPACDGPADFMAALREARLVPGRVDVGYIARAAYQHFYRKLFGRLAPGFGCNVRDYGPAFSTP